LLFTEFQTVFAALYDDRLSVVFEGNYEGDTDTAEYLTGLSSAAASCSSLLDFAEPILCQCLCVATF
jgi:hypothetical protein